MIREACLILILLTPAQPAIAQNAAAAAASGYELGRKMREDYEARKKEREKRSQEQAPEVLPIVKRSEQVPSTRLKIKDIEIGMEWDAFRRAYPAAECQSPTAASCSVRVEVAQMPGIVGVFFKDAKVVKAQFIATVLPYHQGYARLIEAAEKKYGAPVSKRDDGDSKGALFFRQRTWKIGAQSLNADWILDVNGSEAAVALTILTTGSQEAQEQALVEDAMSDI